MELNGHGKLLRLSVRIRFELTRPSLEWQHHLYVSTNHASLANGKSGTINFWLICAQVIVYTVQTQLWQRCGLEILGDTQTNFMPDGSLTIVIPFVQLNCRPQRDLLP